MFFVGIKSLLCILCVVVHYAAAQPAAIDSVKAKIGQATWDKMISRINNEVNKNLKERGIGHLLPQDKYCLTGYMYNQYFDWDLYFENIYQSYFGISNFNFTNLEYFFSVQKDDGFISRMFGYYGLHEHQHFKPFIAQTALLGARQSGNWDWIKSNYDAIKKYLDLWESYDSDGNGLSYWPGGADHSGMDNQWSRTVGRSQGVDLNCYLVREFQAMSLFAGRLGYTADKTTYAEKAETLKDKINQLLYDESRGLYYDRDENTNRLTIVRSISCFTPLWTEVASPEQAERLMTHLTDTGAFWLKYPVATYAKTEPDYNQNIPLPPCNWLGTTWIPTNYMIMHGLMKYGYTAVAKELAYKTLDMVLNANEEVFEFYNAETGAGTSERDLFFAWSILGFMFPIEAEMNYDPSTIDTVPLKSIGPMMGITYPEPFVVASSEDWQAENNLPHKVYDQDNSSYYASLNNPPMPQYLTFIWYTPQTFSKVTLKSNYCKRQAPTNWDIEVSDDGVSGWSKVASSGAVTWDYNSSTVESTTVSFPQVTGKMGMRIKINRANLSNGRFVVTEIGIDNEQSTEVTVHGNAPIGGHFTAKSFVMSGKRFVLPAGFNNQKSVLTVYSLRGRKLKMCRINRRVVDMEKDLELTKGVYIGSIRLINE